MLFAKCKRGICTLVSIVVCLSAFVIFQGAKACRLGEIEGKRTFYLYTPSSQATQKTTLDFLDVFHVQGESVCFEFLGTDDKKQELVQEILKKYRAELVVKEEILGTVSYYAYTPTLFKGVSVQGKRVNLHIAIGETQAAVGTPIIFGGF